MYAGVIIDNKTDHTDAVYTYAVPEGMELEAGAAVKVPFGRGSRLHDGYVVSVQEEPDAGIKGIKNIEAVDEAVSLTQEMVDTALFMKRRYLCRAIDAISCFLPAGAASKRGRQRQVELPEKEDEEAFRLTDAQAASLAAIGEAIAAGRHEIFLLHGVTGSGKTEVYMQAAAKTLARGQSVIVLVPEISLTGQIIRRFFSRFGEGSIAVLHSKLSNGQRYDEWQKIRQGGAGIVIGARSAIFAPLENIGLIIMDEEHETSYKSDMSPKYDTLEIAIKRAKAFGGSVILGSATPSVVSYERAQEGIYTLLTLPKRYNEVALPRVRTVDMRKELLAGNKTILSRDLAAAMEENLAAKKQIILFLNRRGYSTFISCRECGYSMKCPECGISMTYHKESKAALCHYCGRKFPLPTVCPKCGSRYIKHFGAGTEKVEEFIGSLFEDARIARLDFDTAKAKGSTEKILGDFGKGKTDILIGTQLVAKGLDFRNVGLVGIISADVSLNIPDFRASERTFQLITQAAGRAGRGDEIGDVIIQTYTPEHYAVQAAAAQDYDTFYKKEIHMRQLLGYPPYCDLAQMIFRAEDEKEAAALAREGYEFLRRMMGEKLSAGLFPPKPAPLRSEGGKFRYQLLLKIPKGERARCAAYISALKQEFFKKGKINQKKNQALLLVDFNPYGML